MEAKERVEREGAKESERTQGPRTSIKDWKNYGLGTISLAGEISQAEGGTTPQPFLEGLTVPGRGAGVELTEPLLSALALVGLFVYARWC